MESADDRFHRILDAPADERAILYDHAYNVAEPGLTANNPNRRRRRRIAQYCGILRGRRDILEIGCGTGDLTAALAHLSDGVVAIDLSARRLEIAAARTLAQPGARAQPRFVRMNAVALDFPARSLDGAISTSLIEHLHPGDVDIHLAEVRRVLRPGGIYLIWCPNRLGHHQDREFHLTMMSYADLIGRARRAGFTRFSSPLFARGPLVDARFKIAAENMLSRLGLRTGWSHLGLRNILLVAHAGTA
jgi:SAM-dependent methyltransferase